MEATTDLQALQATIDALKAEYGEQYTWGVRWDERTDLPVGFIFEESRIWVDGDPTGETLPGTCALEDSHLDTISRFSHYSGKPYIVCGILSLYGEDDGEVILRECEVMAVP